MFTLTSQGSFPYVRGCSPLHSEYIKGFSPLYHRVLSPTLTVLSLNVYIYITGFSPNTEYFTGFSPLCHRVLSPTLQSTLPKCLHFHHRVLSLMSLQSALPKSLHLHHGVLSLTSQSALLIDKLVRMVDYTSMSWLYILFSIMAI